jgi:PAS domain S-box-containing protein
MLTEPDSTLNPGQQCRLRILLIEDAPDDVELCLRLLKKICPDHLCDIVKSPTEFAHQLRTNWYDVILADYRLESWTGMDAFYLMRSLGRDIPFIIVTGVLGDEKAIECVKAGITDYILKDHLERLDIAIFRALKERAVREEYKRVEEALFKNEARFQALAETISAATFIEHGSRCTYVNRAAEKITGYNTEELLKMNFQELIVPASRKVVMGRLAAHFGNRHVAVGSNLQIRTKQGEVRWVDVTVRIFEVRGDAITLITASGITAPSTANADVRPSASGCFNASSMLDS